MLKTSSLEDLTTMDQVEHVATILEHYTALMRKDPDDEILHVGCRGGLVTSTAIPPFFGEFKRIVGTDPTDENFRYARVFSSNYVKEYCVLDIIDTEGVKEFRSSHGLFTKIFCFTCYDWIRDPPAAMTNIKSLMKTNGECYFAFAGQSPVYDCYPKLAEDPRFSQHIKNYQEFIPPSHSAVSEHHDFFRDLLEDAGLRVLMCETLVDEKVIRSKDDVREHVKEADSLGKVLPPELRADFTEACYEMVYEKVTNPLQYKTLIGHAIYSTESSS